jgi:hypothetical protein
MGKSWMTRMTNVFQLYTTQNSINLLCYSYYSYILYIDLYKLRILSKVTFLIFNF